MTVFTALATVSGDITNYLRYTVSGGYAFDRLDLLVKGPRFSGELSYEPTPNFEVGANYLYSKATSRASGDIVVRAAPGRSLPPFTMRGAGGWVSGYVVPVMSGKLDGAIAIGRDTINLSGGAGYHDHNWGFWEGVSWQWGQVQHDDMSIVFGRVFPPRDAADPERIPGFLMAIGPEGPIGHATRIVITLSVWMPGSTACSCMRLRSISPAPMSRTNDTAT